jgi:predicted dehydrogenase
MNSGPPSDDRRISRRDFLGTGAVALTAGLGGAAFAAPADLPTRKLKLGVVGNGGRGAWIAKLFQAHGGYEMWAVADYFTAVAEQCGAELGVDPSRRFATLSGYKKLLDSGVDAVALETPCYFLPEQAAAAVAAGKHVYMAKPVAVDVPGALRVLAAGQEARWRKQAFLIDYQMPTDPVNLDVVRRIHAGGLGKLVHLRSSGIAGGLKDPPKTDTIESRLRELIWVSDVALGCDSLGNFDIHAIDAALWLTGERPVAASGRSALARPDPHGDARDVCSLVYEYESGVIHNHYGQNLKNNAAGELSVAAYGTEANALVNYWGKSFLKGGAQHFGGGEVTGLYQAGAQRNIARFHRAITAEDWRNETLERSVDGVLTCLLGMEAAERGTRLTMRELLRENRRREVDLRGLKT